VYCLAIAETKRSVTEGDLLNDFRTKYVPARVVRTGSQFFDDKQDDRGWATTVNKLVRDFGKITVLEVFSAEPALASFLKSLDRRRLRIQHSDPLGECYTFIWASGYDDGTRIRVQGVLQVVPVGVTTRVPLDTVVE
jgi:hypothetical protein